MKKLYSPKMSQKAFTLIELLVVIAIIGILSAIVMAGVNAARAKAKISTAKADLKQIFNAVNMLENDTEQWPGNKTPGKKQCLAPESTDNEICPDGCLFSLNDCESGLVCDDGTYTGWQGSYIKEIPKDPWGNEYFFDTDYYQGADCIVALGSYGPNGTGRNNYDADNILYIINAK